MTGNYVSSLETFDRAAYEANIRNAHLLRSQYLAGLIQRAAKAVSGWARKIAPERQIGHLNNHLLKDIGFNRDPLSGLVLAALKQDDLSLSPTGNLSAPAFRKRAAAPAENANDGNETLKAA
ncbi:MAG TPA: hypothetical protein QGH84_06135 [Rhodospirillales bacterium]|jgi:uncharacterized protein YjiS (DUF1127 family)|nr:hypothetical protein [Rhodospirillales bacterium]